MGSGRADSHVTAASSLSSVCLCTFSIQLFGDRKLVDNVRCLYVTCMLSQPVAQEQVMTTMAFTHVNDPDPDYNVKPRGGDVAVLLASVSGITISYPQHHFVTSSAHPDQSSHPFFSSSLPKT